MRRIQYPKPADEAYHDLVRAMGQIGPVDSSSQLTHTVTGRVAFGNFSEGVCTATLQASVIEAVRGSCLIEIEAVSGTGSVPQPEAISMLLKALDDPNYKPGP